MFVSIKKIGQGNSIDHVINQFPEVKRNFLFLVIQEYYRNYENNNKILLDYVHDKTPKNILTLLKICLTLLYFSNKPQYAIVNDAVEEGKNLIRSANNGISAHIDATGKIVSKLKSTDRGFIEIRNILKKKNTFFNSFGNKIFFYFLIFYISFIFFLKKKKI